MRESRKPPPFHFKSLMSLCSWGFFVYIHNKVCKDEAGKWGLLYIPSMFHRWRFFLAFLLRKQDYFRVVTFHFNNFWSHFRVYLHFRCNILCIKEFSYVGYLHQPTSTYITYITYIDLHQSISVRLNLRWTISNRVNGGLYKSQKSQTSNGQKSPTSDGQEVGPCVLVGLNVLFGLCVLWFSGQ